MENRTPDETPVFMVKPIGYVRNRSEDASWGNKLQSLPWQERANRMKEQTEVVSEILINQEMADGMDGLEEYSHLDIIYWPHLVPKERRAALKVHPMGSPDFPLVGVFATRSPIRPNSILVTTVRLLERKGTTLRVTGLDALDGSPVLDIKPHSAWSTGRDEIVVPDWMKRMNRKFGDRTD